MVILGIDPGTATTGFGVIEFKDVKLKMIDHGVITTNHKLPMPQRLKIIFDDLEKIIKSSKPDWIAIEQLFFAANTKTAISVGQARGVVLLAAQKADLNIAEYTPLQVKQAVTGYGQATKKQIQQMVKTILNLKLIPKPDDAADALAIAICHSAAVKNRLIKNEHLP
ncbi:MAG: crossover junction endodeoxyribonuclease RuvC [bacterium]|nr:crossover junction endodeoxyribonuclease RuvC [bacterium]